MMKRPALLLLLALCAVPAAAADFEAGIRHIVSLPMGEKTFDGGELDIPLSRGFSANAELFFSERVSAHFAAKFLNPEAILYPENPPPNDVDLGTLGLDIYSLTARWHFAPERRLSAFAGAGGAVVSIGNLDDQFGEEVEAEFDSELTFVVEGGVRYRFRPRIFLEVSAAYVPLEAEPHVLESAYALPEAVQVNPVIVSLGASWRF